MLLGLVVCPPDSVPVGVGCNRGDYAQEPVDLLVSDLGGLVDVLAGKGRVGLRVEGGNSCQCGDQHAHWVGVVVEGLHHDADVVVEEGVGHDLPLPVLVLVLGGQLSVDQQEGDLKEVGLLCQLLNGDASVLKNAFVTVNEGDFGGL